MSNDLLQQQRCAETVRGLTVDRIIARVRALRVTGARVVNLRCAAIANAGCDDFAALLAMGMERPVGVCSDA